MAQLCGDLRKLLMCFFRLIQFAIPLAHSCASEGFACSSLMAVYGRLPLGLNFNHCLLFSLATLFPRPWPVLPRLVRGLSLAFLALSLNIPRVHKHKPRRKQNHDPYYVKLAISSKQDQLPTPSIYRRVLLKRDCDKLWSRTSGTEVKGFGGTSLNCASAFPVKVHWNSVRKGAAGVF